MNKVPAMPGGHTSHSLFAAGPLRPVRAAFVVSCVVLVGAQAPAGSAGFPATPISPDLLGLRAWQRSAERPETGHFKAADAAALLGAGAEPVPADLLAGLRQQPLAEADYDGAALAVGYASLRVTLDTEASQAVDICRSGFLDFPGDAHRTPCRAVVARIAVDGTNVLTATATLPDHDGDIKGLNLRVAIRRLDPATALPQVVISDYIGGAHCCTETGIATQRPDGSWQVVIPGEIDGDAGFAFLDLDGDRTGVLVDGADGFLYQYASYAGSFAPTRIRKLSGTTLQDVTRDPRYRGFLLQELKRMDRAEVPSERNGYLAARVAQAALAGEFMDAWRAMLAAYDPLPREGRSVCAADGHGYTVVSVTGPACPAGRERLVSFPAALAVHLVQLGYITPEQSAALGYDPAAIEADRGAAADSRPTP
jgi:hypothetical protein